jgi:hypothetical protein
MANWFHRLLTWRSRRQTRARLFRLCGVNHNGSGSVTLELRRPHAAGNKQTRYGTPSDGKRLEYLESVDNPP